MPLTYLHSYSTPLIDMIVLELIWSVPGGLDGWRSPSLHCNAPHFTFLQKVKYRRIKWSTCTEIQFCFEYLLDFTFLIVAIRVFATMTIYWAFGIELVIALLIGCHTTIEPNFFTLTVQCWTFSIKTVAFA